MEDLKEETGLTCCICREGYRYQPQKVLGIYTFTKRVPLEEFETKQRKSQGYSTVSHFNLVHVDCHMAAVRHARGREEWESAALQNASTKCNGLLPLWGPQVQESAFATCLARHNTYLQECTGVRDASYTFTTHDLKMLIWRFAEERSFSEDSGGGGRQSNIFLIPYLAHIALYVINTTRTGPREEKNITTFLEAPKEKWLENCFEVESPMYWTAMCILIIPYDRWKEIRLRLLKHLILQAHARKVCPGGAKTLADKEVKEFSDYKQMLVFFGLINFLYEKSLKKVTVAPDSSWPQSLADYIRNNDRVLMEAGDKILSAYEEELLPCESFAEFADVTGLLEEIAAPDAFISELLASVP